MGWPPDTILGDDLSEILYILTRTSGRPNFFARCKESIRALKWDGPIVHLVHTDDPRDNYIEADIIVRGETLGPSFGSGFYNLYNNRLLKAVPNDKPGWVHFIDDDDEYVGPDALKWLQGADQEVLHVCKTRRLGVSKHCEIFPNRWKKQQSFQTECFALWSTIAKRYEWWGEKGGDHNYTRKITRKYPIAWHDHIATQAQSGKGHGECLDANGMVNHINNLDPKSIVHFKMFQTVGRGRKQAQLIDLTAAEALVLEKFGYGRITYKGITVISNACD